MGQNKGGDFYAPRNTGLHLTVAPEKDVQAAVSPAEGMETTPWKGSGVDRRKALLRVSPLTSQR